MRIGITTIHRGLSYGSITQAYGLKTYLATEIGAEVEFIDLFTKQGEDELSMLPKIRSIRDVARFVRTFPYYRDKISKNKKFERFCEKHFTRSKRFYTVEQVQADPPLYDVYITGSDQVFRANKKSNRHLFYYLNFCKDLGKPRIAYAGSFGQEQIPVEKKTEVTELLNGFNALSARETEACELIKSLVNKEVYFVVDPVNLLSQDEWRKIAKPVAGLPPRFILVYKLLGHDILFEMASKIKELSGLPIVMLDVSIPSRHKSDVNIFDIGVEEFVWLMDNAEFVVTNSFHGTSFSVIFEKNFYSYKIPEPGFITRSRSYLSSIDLADRIIAKVEDINQGNLRIDYRTPNNLRDKRIEYSKEYLRSALLGK